MNVILWFIWRRWMFKRFIEKSLCFDRQTFSTLLLAKHNLNTYGCRKHPVIYNDMCRIVRGVK